LLYKFTF